MSEWTVDPLVPGSLLLLLAAAAAALLAAYARARPASISPVRWVSSLILTAAGMTTVLGVLLNPTRVRAVPGPEGKPLLTILVDASASMTTCDSPGERPRYDSAAETAGRLANDLADRFEVRLRAFSNEAASVDAKDLPSVPLGGARSNLAMALIGAIDGDRPAGQAIALLSDGIDNAGGSSAVLEAARLVRSMAAPVFTQSIGTEVNTFDVELELRSPQDLAFIGQQVPLTVKIRQVGGRVAASTVRLFRDGTEIASRPVDLSPVAGVDVVFMVSQERIGLYPYQVKIDPVPEEVSSANNSASYLLRVVDEPIRVLVLEGRPYWDSKFLLRTLSGDEAIALDCLVKVADNRFIRRTLSRQSGGSSTDGLPPRMETWRVDEDARDVLAAPEGLRGYQVIVLGRDAEAFLSEPALDNLTEWIARDGGSLVCYRGSPTAQASQKLARLLPVEWAAAAESRFRLKLTETGRELNLWPTRPGEALTALPSLASAQAIEQTKPLAVVLATTGDDAPAVVYQHYGAGRVVVIEGAGMWRWAFLSPAHQAQEDIYRGLWQSLLRWLTSAGTTSAGEKLSLRADKVTFLSSEPAAATLLSPQDITPAGLPQVELATADGANPRRFTPTAMGDETRTYRIDFGPLPEGSYRARIVGAPADDAAAQAVFEVRELTPEQIDLRARHDLMQRVADLTGGAAIDPADPAGALSRQFNEHLARTRPQQFQRDSAWDRWWVLTLLMGFWTAAWTIRRSGGLV